MRRLPHLPWIRHGNAGSWKNQLTQINGRVGEVVVKDAMPKFGLFVVDHIERVDLVQRITYGFQINTDSDERN